MMGNSLRAIEGWAAERVKAAYSRALQLSTSRTADEEVFGPAFGLWAWHFVRPWLRLKEIVPGIERVAVLRDPSQGASTGDFAVIQAMAPLLRVQITPINLREAGEIESAVADFARASNAGLIMPGSAAGSFMGISSLHSRRGISCQQCTLSATSPPLAA
jgi:hypothetical protein